MLPADLPVRPRRLRLVAPLAGLLAVGATLAGCTTDPYYATGPKALMEPIQVAQQSARVHRRPAPVVPRVISICYSNLINEPEQVEAMAAERCSTPGSRLEFFGEDSLLTPCPLLQPVRATFLCHGP